MNGEFGLVHVWTRGDLVTRAVALLLLSMSVASWIVMLAKALELRRHKGHAGLVEGFWRAADFAAGLDELGAGAGNPFRALALDGHEAATHRNAQPRLHDALDASDWVTRALRNSVDEAMVRLQSGLAVLASVGSTAPFVGLFGTVWGIYHALLSIGSAGQASIDRVAAPIGEALIMTALGLAVAIPAVLGYNALVRGNAAVSAGLNRFAHDLHSYFVTGARVSAQAGSRRPDATRDPEGLRTASR